MKPNSDLLLQHLLLAFNDKSQRRHPQHAPLIKCLETALIDYHYNKDVLYPNWLEWLISANNMLHTRAQQRYSVESIQCLHVLLRDRLVTYDKSVKKTQSQNAQDVDFMAEYGFYDYSLILENIHRSASDDQLTSSQEASTSESPALSSDMSSLRRFSFLPPGSSMPSKMPVSLSFSNG